MPDGQKGDKLDRSLPFSYGPRGCLGRKCVSPLIYPSLHFYQSHKPQCHESAGKGKVSRNIMLIFGVVEQSRVPGNAHGPRQVVLEIRLSVVQQRRRRLGERYERLYSVGEATA